MSTGILVTIGVMGGRVQQFSYTAPVKVSTVVDAAGLTAEANGKKLRVRDTAGERDILLTDDLNLDSFILITKEVKGGAR